MVSAGAFGPGVIGVVAVRGDDLRLRCVTKAWSGLALLWDGSLGTAIVSLYAMSMAWEMRGVAMR